METVDCPNGHGGVRAELTEMFADAAQQVGMPRSFGEIFGLIYASTCPLTFADVVTGLGISKGSVSQGLRFLRAVGAIRRIEVTGDAREHFVPETELRRLLAGLLQARVRAPLESASLRLKSLQQRLDTSDAPDDQFLRQRIESLQVWHRSAVFALPLLQRFLGRSATAT